MCVHVSKYVLVCMHLLGHPHASVYNNSPLMLITTIHLLFYYHYYYFISVFILLCVFMKPFNYGCVFLSVFDEHLHGCAFYYYQQPACVCVCVWGAIVLLHVYSHA